MGSSQDVQDAVQVVATVIVAVGCLCPGSVGWFALERWNTIWQVVPAASWAGDHGTPRSVPQLVVSALSAETVTSAMTAWTCAHGPEPIWARTVAVRAPSSTHTQVGMFTTVAPVPSREGFHRTVPFGRSIAS